ncbi:receptor kinase-like protein Xa21 isoform X2 [Rhododendron vialii]|uniref:receptor kinase-like protein Xa21 isoform X2 n=1 Tax=Rhododendron vialii TaxID=182163 RepID=UPI00265E7A9D|nr:receptor kinase-like protein Xa21 isoform X2 [Rhododendron vialii]
MEYNQFTGSIPASIFNISTLEIVGFSYNGLSGNLPATVCHRPSKLQALALPWNNIDGEIPSGLSGCSELQTLSLSFNNFRGRIPMEIGNLTMLKKLYLGRNNLEGEIPQQLGQLKLEVLRMQNDGLTGLVPPVIFNISSLKYLSLANNTLSGSLPMDMCHRLPLLERLYLFGNKFTGSLPSSIGNCTSLKDFSLSRNNFTGSIPQEIVKLGLEGLDMFDNSLTGVLPSDIFNISTLKLLSFAMNHLTGHLPPSISGWSPNIREIYLGQNELSGTIPDSISNASKLYALDLASNSFTGFIPDTLCSSESLQMINFGWNYLTSKSSMSQHNSFNSLMKCKNLIMLIVSYNLLSDIVPVTIGNLSYLEIFWGDNCGIMGNIPGAIGNLSNLMTLSLQDNYLSGTIPATVGQSQKLQYLNLAGNKLQGSIPNTLCGLKNLGYLFLSGNQLYGSLPTCIGNLTFLRKLLVQSNGLTSVIPLSLWDIKDLLVLKLSSNSLSGELPPEIEKLNVAVVIDLSRNQLSGELSSSIGNLPNLAEFSLAQNRLQGPIPQSLGSLTSLEFLDLSRNNLSGTIPGSFEKLSYLKYLNLSFNKLEGEIPEHGPFTNLTALSFMSNKALCGLPQFQVPPCPHTRKRPTERKMLVLRCVLPIAASVILITLVLVFVLTRCQKRKARIPNQDNMFLVTTRRRFSYRELFQATSGFTEDKLLGKGSFSSVYKGTLSDGLTVAIKVFDLQIEGSLRSFDVECDVMRNTRHRNLIKVIGSCSNPDFKALMVDYMPNGTLETWLHNVPDYCLDILQRMNIMIDVASALEYLHHGHLTPVVHCDVKPSNVLLDKDMVAHLGDYGIAKLLRNQESTAQTSTLATIGYIAPEYGSEGIVSTRGDVYSYGILLLETFSRKKPVDEMFVAEMSLRQWVKESLHCAVIDVIDANMLRRGDEHFTVKEHCVKSIMELAVSCCAESPEQRVNVKDVLTTLTKIRVEFLKNAQAKTTQEVVRI